MTRRESTPFFQRGRFTKTQWQEFSEQGSLSKSVCGPFVHNAWNSHSPSSHLTTSFHSWKFWGLVFPALKPWAGSPGVGLGLLYFQRGPPLLRYSSRFLSATRRSETRLFHVSTLPASVLLYILSYRTSVQLPFRHSE